MEVKYVPVSELIPYASNPRKNDNAVSAVAASIREFGFRNPIIIDKNGTIISGHTRLKAALALKLDTVPVIRAEDMTEEQAAAFRLVDNKAQELSSWDFSLLMDELTAIPTIDMTLFGFENPEERAKTEKKAETQGRHVANLDDGYEVDLDDFDKEEFVCTCPECGFKFNE